MRNVEEVVVEAVELVEAIGISVGNIYTISTMKSTKTWGRASYNRIDKLYSISINEKLLEDDVDYMALMNTVVHEVLHCAGKDGECMAHTGLWKRYAEKVNREYNLEIKRLTSQEEKNVVIKTEPKIKYVVECPCCHHQWKYQRMGNVVKYPSRYSCGTCGTKAKLFRVV